MNSESFGDRHRNRRRVLLEWRTNSAADNLGFNVYRVKAGQRTRVNKEIIPGALFASSGPAQMRAVVPMPGLIEVAPLTLLISLSR
jgi:hypothetical protein